MSPRRASFAVLVVASLLLGACGRATVATVDGHAIEGSEVLALRDSYRGEPTVPGDSYRSDLTSLILTETALQAAEDEFGITRAEVEASTSALSATDQELLDSIRQNSPEPTEDLVDLVAVQLALRTAVLGELVKRDGYLEEVWNERPEEVTEVCLRQITTLTVDEADEARARIDAGEDFDAVAADTSIDIGLPGGGFPCPVAASAAADLFGSLPATAPVGEVVGPVQSQFGWHIFIVDERIAPTTLEDLTADPLQYLDADSVSAMFTSWLDEAVAAAEIHVRSQIGTWVPEADGIRPPQ